MNWPRRILYFILVATVCKGLLGQKTAIRVDTFGPEEATYTVVVLHGAAGPGPYVQYAKTLAATGIYVLLPHFYEASRSQEASEANYGAWVEAVDKVVKQRVQTRPDSKVALFGISLGASVALALGTQSAQVASVVEWSGSLPDFYFEHLKRFPPLLIVHGAKDRNVPIGNATQLLTLCRRLEAKCESRILADQEHVFDAAGQKMAEGLTIIFLHKEWPPAATVIVSDPSSR